MSEEKKAAMRSPLPVLIVSSGRRAQPRGSRKRNEEGERPDVRRFASRVAIGYRLTAGF
ncbi:hypothetical protein [Paraburkholderia kururiensis]|uniref:hypothetical protein n=1 Tax=Paraburkholderia kururiensis TaxID=984307 RepID=UPI000AF59729|nr:hypothetical protein [Paraburkholderia kururiensis]